MVILLRFRGLGLLSLTNLVLDLSTSVRICDLCCRLYILILGLDCCRESTVGMCRGPLVRKSIRVVVGLFAYLSCKSPHTTLFCYLASFLHASSLDSVLDSVCGVSISSLRFFTTFVVFKLYVPRLNDYVV
jgi:hypothetical protein